MALPAIWPYVLGAVLLFALIILVLLVMLLRRSAKSSEFVDAEEPEDEAAPAAAKEPVEAGPVADISAAFRRAGKYIDRAADGDRKNVPLFLLVGDQGSREGDMLGEAGIDLTWGVPEEAGTALGEGRGFWVFDRGVVLDVVGEEAAWDDVISHLQRLRPKRPIDGVIMTLSAAELLEAATSEVKRTDLAARAAKTYRKLWDAQQKLGFRLPTYILVTGCDKVTGFRAVTASLHEQSRRQILGWSNPNGIESVYRGQWIDEAFETLGRRLDDVTMEVFAEGTTEGDQLVRFTPAMLTLQTGLRATLDSLFKSSAYHGTLIFRGLYFCGRENEPVTEDAPATGRVAFLAEVLDRKVFIEHRLASPTARTVMARNRAVTIVKTAAAACFVLTLLSLGWAAYLFHHENAILEPVLNQAAEAMESTSGREPTNSELSSNAISLLNGMANIDFNRYDSVVVPASWFDPYQARLEHAFSDAFHDIILRAIRSDLKAKSRSLVPLDEATIQQYDPSQEAPAAGPYGTPSGIVPATLTTSLPATSTIVPAAGVTVETVQMAQGGGQPLMPDPRLSSVTGDGAPAWVDGRLAPVGTMPEFLAMRNFIAQLKELDEQVNGFNKLRETGDLRQVGRLVKYSWGIELPESFYKKSHLYKHALLNAQYEPLRPKADFQIATTKKLTRMANDFHDALFRRNPFAARLQRLSSTIQNVTWQPPAAGDTAPLQSISDQLKRVDGDLSGPELEWAFKREFDLGPDYNSMLADINGTSYMGPAVARQFRDATAARWGRFQQGLTWASSPLTKTILSVHEDRPEMHLSKEAVLLQSALQTFLGQSFVVSARRPGPIKVDLPEGYRLNWNTTSLEQAVAVAQAYDRFRTGTLQLFPPDVRVSIDQVARERALADMLDSIARARLEEPVAYVDSPAEREEQIRLDVARFNALVPALETVLEASSKLSPEAGRLIAGPMSAEAYRMLRNIDGLLERDRPYATLEDLGQWDGGVPPSPRVWGKSDDAELASWLDATRGRIAFVAMNYARPPLAWLTKSQMAARPDTRELVTSWQAIVDDVRDHDSKKPGNPISVLEDYIGVRMAKVTANDCTAATLPAGFRGRSFFGLTAQDLARRVRSRCLELAGRDSTSRYAVLERYFNQRLAGRYPFAENQPRQSEAEADPTDVKTFFKMFDENKAALIAPVAQGGLTADQAAVRKWVEDMSKVRAFFASFLDAPRPELAPSLDLEATFRVLKQRELDGQQIAGWSFEVGDQSVNNRQANKKLRWTAGQPIRVALRWAADAPRIPVVSGQPRANLAEERTVVWEYNNRWSLLTVIADHPTRSEELPEYQDVLPVTMGFDLATKPVGGPLSDITPARVFMRVALLAPGTNQPVELPALPDPRAAHRVDQGGRTVSLPEVSRFLAPISEDRPAGEWLRFDPLYDEIKLLREKDDPSLPQGVWQRELKRADWPGVARLCQDALETRTKDLQIAAWMTEAWTDIHGFRGFERGINVLAGLCRTFWDEVYPAAEDGDHDARIAPIAWAADKLILPLKSIPITAAGGEETMAYAWRDWESAQFLAKSTAKPSAPVPDKVVTQSKFMVAISMTPANRFVATEAEILGALAALDDLDAALTEKLGLDNAPSLMPLRTPLTSIQQFVTRIRAERGERSEAMVTADHASAMNEEVPMSGEEIPATVVSLIGSSSTGGAITTRAEAYHRLREASDFLMRTEPHSPVPYLVRRAISWGNLSLAELLEELLQKNADLPTINTLLGIRKS